MKRHFLSVVICLSLGLFVSGCFDSDDVGDSYTTFTGKKISDFLSEHQAEFSEFIQVLEKAEAWPLMESYGKYTLFVPTNDAMRAYYMEKGDGVNPMDIDTLNAKDLRKLVFYHIIDG